MRPDKKAVTDLFAERSQYLIPLFQRGYVWTLNEQVQPLGLGRLEVGRRPQHVGERAHEPAA